MARAPEHGISALVDAQGLEEPSLSQTKKLRPEDFRILAKLPKLERASVYFGAHKRDAEFERLLKEIGVTRHGVPTGSGAT
jgi:hypothetical protein